MKSIYRKYIKVGALIWAVCFIILLLCYLVVLAPQEKLHRMTEKKLADTKLLAQSAEEAAQEENKNLLLGKLSKSSEQLSNFVIGQENMGNLTLDIGRISNEVELDSIKSSFTGGERTTTKTDNYKHIIPRYISVNFNSSFNKFATFLNTLERNQPVFFIDTFSITRSPESDSGHKVDMKLAVLVGKDAKAKGIDG